MVTKGIKNIFLSASVPLPERDPKFFQTADIIAIREAVIALTSVVLPHHCLIWGGHTSITPLIYYVMEKRNLNVGDHVKLYQSKFFEESFLEDNNKFKNVVLTDVVGDQEKCLAYMRKRMFDDNSFSAAIFIGGMEGIEIEYRMFIEKFPDAIILPIASTGGATKLIYDNIVPEGIKNERFVKDYGYMSLFQKFLIDKL